MAKGALWGSGATIVLLAGAGCATAPQPSPVTARPASAEVAAAPVAQTPAAAPAGVLELLGWPHADKLLVEVEVEGRYLEERWKYRGSWTWSVTESNGETRFVREGEPQWTGELGGLTMPTPFLVASAQSVRLAERGDVIEVQGSEQVLALARQIESKARRKSLPGYLERTFNRDTVDAAVRQFWGNLVVSAYGRPSRQVNQPETRKVRIPEDGTIEVDASISDRWTDTACPGATTSCLVLEATMAVDEPQGVASYNAFYRAKRVPHVATGFVMKSVQSMFFDAATGSLRAFEIRVGRVVPWKAERGHAGSVEISQVQTFRFSPSGAEARPLAN